MKYERHELPLDDVPPGTTLADDLRDAHGNILMPRGATLSETALASLRRRDVASVPVLLERKIPEEVLAAQRARIEARLAHLFRHAGNDAAAQFLRAQVARYREENDT